MLSQLPVLIVGAGPSGLFAAAELARHGVRARVVEQKPAPHRETRATAIQPAGLEALARAGTVEPFLRSGVLVRSTQFLGPGLREIATASFSGIGCDHEYQCSLPQWQTEAILRAHLEQLGGAVELATAVVSVDDCTNGLRITLERDGHLETMMASYLLGAGGAHGMTRDSMRQRLAGETYSGRYVVADIRLQFPCPPGQSMVIVGPTGFVLLSPLPDNRWVTFVNRGDTDTRDEPPTEAALNRLISTRISADAGVFDLHWVSYFSMHRRIVNRLCDGRRFLLGDAGHLSSPLGGEGLNSALMDAADIGWKLALVLNGAAQPSLLESYGIERGLADRHVLEVSDAAHRRVVDLVAMCAAGEPPRLPPSDPARDRAAARRRAMLDVTYAGSSLVDEAGASSAHPCPGERFPACSRLRGNRHHLITFGATPGLAGFATHWRGLIEIVDGARADFNREESGVPARGAVLVRPDGFIGFRAVPLDETTLGALDTHLGTYLVPPRTA